MFNFVAIGDLEIKPKDSIVGKSRERGGEGEGGGGGKGREGSIFSNEEMVLSFSPLLLQM